MRVNFGWVLSGAIVGSFLLSPAPYAGQATQTRSGGSANKVQVKAAATKPDAAGNQVLTVLVTIDKGWYIYANLVGNKGLTPNRTTLEMSAKMNLEGVNIVYPPGKFKKHLGEEFNIYEGTITIRAGLRRAPGDAGPLNLTLKLNACNGNQCLPPGEIKVSVP